MEILMAGVGSREETVMIKKLSATVQSVKTINYLYAL